MVYICTKFREIISNMLQRLDWPDMCTFNALHSDALTSFEILMDMNITNTGKRYVEVFVTDFRL